MLESLAKSGIRSDHLYAAAVASIGLSFVSWVMSRLGEDADTDRADRWGIFVGEWAPTLMAMGVALRLEEGAESSGR